MDAFKSFLLRLRAPGAKPSARRKALIFALSVSSCFSFAMEEQDPPRILDLTHPFSEASVYWPTAEAFRLELDFKGHTEAGYFYSAYRFAAAEHGGTHIDAPVHFAEGMPAVDEIPLERLIGPAVLVDLADRVDGQADYQIGPEDLRDWESRHGEIPAGHILLIHTGWGRHYPDRKQYLGTDKRGEEAVAELHFPGLHPDGARWLVEQREILAVGLDTASIDHGQSQLFESHQILFKASIPVFENVARLDALPTRGFQVVALPMKIEGGSGGPLRIVAILGSSE